MAGNIDGCTSMTLNFWGAYGWRGTKEFLKRVNIILMVFGKKSNFCSPFGYMML